MQDISEDHMKLLLEYMYKGSISVKQHELQEILKTACSLQIHGLTTDEAPSPDIETPRPLIVDEQQVGKVSEPGVDRFQQVETGSSHSGTSGESVRNKRRTDGRKSSKPKKLRLSENRETVTSPMYPMMSSPRFPMMTQEM